ncbi:peptidoglycan DD-metalloendopeptidase family protein [Geomonas nitrogeniifigens]|uniref:Peptidoglycan DD-metalloendopeptidase family protein n=1 Tax=Geomonas diazotrophica TaxID=2843197 RepID=A0ABX8JMH2_9BACT|nr:peptidoglycan DD-metalloendopeptidase family protein [Geomonas nitrogeniifigens]QWV98572.1 peptidoglycan DD-metalloendopeptidase family protein [Geomonas nitrogeniifigens]
MKKQAIALRWKGRSRLAGVLLPASFLCALSVSPAQADFFRYTDESGVEVFTNTPTTSGAVRVLREAKQPKPKARMQQAPPVSTSGKEAPDLGGLDAKLPVQGVITSGYGMRHDPIDGGLRHHNGVDIAVPTGTRVKAIAAGRVIESGVHGGYGNLVTVQHADGMVSMYGHNSQLEVKIGDQVEAGQTVALSGSTGRSTGPHVHFELWKNGINVTRNYLDNGAGIPEVTGSIRSYLHKDGSLVFTNIN